MKPFYPDTYKTHNKPKQAEQQQQEETIKIT